MQACRLKIRRNFLTQTVLNDWNKLPSYVVEAPSVNSFKNRLDDFLADYGQLIMADYDKSAHRR